MGFQQGLSGLNVSSKNLEVIGNNVANASTFGAKTARAEFSDMYANALNGAGSNNIGIGATLSTVAQQFTQGNITTTENPLDLAINGNGFFMLNTPNNQQVYSRNGQFKLNNEGFIVNNGGHKLLGNRAENGEIISGPPVPLVLPTDGIQPQRTEEVTLEMTFDSRADIASGTGVDFDDPRTFNFATSQTVYDDKGQALGLTYYFRKTGNDSWDMYATANGTSVQVDGAGDPARVANITFPATGGTATNPTNPALLNPGDPGTITTYDAGGAALAISGNGIFTMPTITGATLANGTPILDINIGAFDMSKSTEFGTSFGVTNLAQNGYARGELSSMTVENDGTVLARYSNGQSKAAGQVVLATFRNPQGLQSLGGNEWANTIGSGDPIPGAPGSGNVGLLQSGALEESNVDLTGELVNMIVAQRMYQANAQTIKAEDQVLQTLVNLR